MSNRTLSTPEELQDFCTGKMLYAEGKSLNDCANQTQRMGWYRALNAQKGSEVCDGFARQYKRSGLLVYEDLYGSWLQVGEDEDASRVYFSESALAAATNRPEYHLQGVDYTEPSIQ